MELKAKFGNHVVGREITMLDSVVPVISKLERMSSVHPAQHSTPVVIWSAVFARSPSASNAESLRAVADSDHRNL